ncbi:MAG: YjjG family noncanonical pyrimidine nucleotidase [Flammeovirgaceae bacterium]
MSLVNCKHVFFDLDHTLWDFERNSVETLSELYHEFDIGVLSNESLETFLEVFKEVNAKLWDMFNRNKIEKFYIRQRRFELVFHALDVAVEDVPEGIAELYLQRCPLKPHLLPYTVEILDYLKGKYELHILSNGFGDVQETKLRNSGIFDYFQVIVNSESTGFKKPDRRIFDYALEQANANVEESVMIGDNLRTDMAGARGIGMRHVFFNPGQLEHFQHIDFEINHLKELEALL